MLEFTENLGICDLPATETLTLTLEQRSKARQRVELDSGKDAGLFLERGHTLSEGDILRATDGTLAAVRCRPEAVVTASACDWQTLSRACYHLGNRHAALQIGELHVRFQPDHVLEELAERLGLQLNRETLPFVPEHGAYGNHMHG